eukprot:s3530_g6.t1
MTTRVVVIISLPWWSSSSSPPSPPSAPSPPSPVTRHPSPFYYHISIIILTVTIQVVSMQLVLNFVVFWASVACLVGRKHKPWQKESTK